MQAFQDAAVDQPSRPSVKLAGGNWVVTVKGRDNWRKIAEMASIPSDADQQINGDTITFTWPSVADRIFGKDGMIASTMDDYEVRTGQLHLARMIQAAVQLREPLFGEAPTGTGKSFAYLAPLLALGKKVIVSTSNKALQMQLYKKDVPFLQSLFPGKKVALVQGKTNYVCLDKVKNGVAEPELAEWLCQTQSGNIEELTFDLQQKDRYTLDDECTGKRCKFFADCYYYKAKAERKNADIIICNHALLAINALYPLANILPTVDAVVVDEAHQLPQYVRNALGIQLISSKVERILSLIHECSVDVAHMYPTLREFEKEINRFISDMPQEKQVGVGDDVVFDAGTRLAFALREAANEIWSSSQDPLDANEMRLFKRAERVRNLARQIVVFSNGTRDGHVRWVDMDGPTLNDAPYDVAGFIHSMIHGIDPEESDDSYTEDDDPVFDDVQGVPTYIFVSATLASPTLSSFMAECGTNHGLQLIAESPFDYAKNSLLYVPKATAPSPDSREYLPWLADEMRRSVYATNGGAFLLFTSYRNLQHCLGALRYEFERHFPVYVQGELPKMEIAKRFAADGNAVLFATKSFWEGVDIPGDALRNVGIDKMPFPAPSPLLKARQNAVGDKDAFRLILLPEMLLDLKQGVGRLIRRATDRGVVCIFDPRIRSKPYGRNIVLKSLPPSRLIASIAPITEFFAPVPASSLRDITNLTDKTKRIKVEDFTLAF